MLGVKPKQRAIRRVRAEFTLARVVSFLMAPFLSILQSNVLSVLGNDGRSVITAGNPWSFVKIR